MTTCLSSFLWTSATFAYFHSSGKTHPVSIVFWEIILIIILRTELPHSCNIRTEILSKPCDLLGFIDLIIDKISSFLKEILKEILINLFSVLYSIKSGRTLSFLIGIHWERNYLLNKQSFSLQSAVNLLFVTIGRILGVCNLLISFFKNFQ